MTWIGTRIDRLRSRREADQTGASGAAPSGRKLYPPTTKDAIAAVTGGVAGVPDGMASGVLADVNPVYGVYTLIVMTPLAALFSSSRFMVVNTTSAMTLVAVSGLEGRSGEDRIAALFTIALVAGLFQLLLGLLGLGMLTRFVSNAAMTGFLTGIAVLIVLAQLGDLTGYDAEGSGRIAQTIDLLKNINQIDVPTTLVGVGSIIMMLVLRRTRLANFTLLIALGMAVAVVKLVDLDSVALVSSLGEIPASLPRLEVPSLGSLGTLLPVGVAVGAVGLLQAAGVAQRYPDHGGAQPDDSRDFIAQGAANVAGSFFQGMAAGGSLSGTALNVAAGAETRWALILQSPIVIVLLLVFSGLLSAVPMASLAALLIYSAVLSIKLNAILSVGKTTVASATTMVATFVAALTLPLQVAVLLGVILAAILYIYRASSDLRVVEIRTVGDGYEEVTPPKTLPGDSVTVLDTYGSLFYASARSLHGLLPAVGDAQRPVVVLRIRGRADLGSTFLGIMNGYANQLREHSGKLLLSGVDPAVKTQMLRTGHLTTIGEEDVFTADHVIGRSSRAAFAAGQEWLEKERAVAIAEDAARGDRTGGPERVDAD